MCRGDYKGRKETLTTELHEKIFQRDRLFLQVYQRRREGVDLGQLLTLSLSVWGRQRKKFLLQKRKTKKKKQTPPSEKEMANML